MSSNARKHKTIFKKKKSTNSDYWGDEPEPQYTEEQKKRIASYLKENDENCKESTTLILIIVIGLLIALSIVGFLAIRNNPSIKYKGSHTTYEHTPNSTIMDTMWSKWNWLQDLYYGIDTNNTNQTADSTQIQAIVALERELDDFQPIYRNPLLQALYTADNEQCNDVSDDSLYNFVTIRHGSWVPSQQYLTEAVDFSWADFESEAEKEEIALIQNEDAEDMTDKDEQNRKSLKQQIKKNRKERRQNEHNKDQRRRLLSMGKNRAFDPRHVLPNPANILRPNKKGDEGAGDVEEEAFKNPDAFKAKLPKGFMPGWLEKHGALPGSLKDRLPMLDKKHLKHLDEMRQKHKPKILSPQDILKQMDLSKFGIFKRITDQTTDDEKRNDLAILEKKESKRHPFMTLLTNPGDMDDVQCIKNDYRKHEVVLQTTSTNLGDVNGKQSAFEYKNDMLMWYCYLVTVQSEGISSANGGSFKVNLTLYDVNMEIGFDYVEIYINSQLVDTVSGIGLNWEENEQTPQFVYYMDSDYVERAGNSLEVCMKIVTDGSIVKDGFKSILSVDFDDPQITKWSDWTECKTLKAWHYNGLIQRLSFFLLLFCIALIPFSSRHAYICFVVCERESQSKIC